MRRYFGAILLIGLAISCVASLLLGVRLVSPAEAIEGLTTASSPLHPILWEIRLPRIALALVVGAALAVAGAISQALFANPIAEPTIVGIASGGALGLLVAVSLGIASIGTFAAAVAALVGALIVALVLTRFSNVSALAFLLSGIAIAAVLNSVVGLVTAVGGRSDLRSIAFWSLGSISLASWPGFFSVAPLVVLGLLLAFFISAQLDYFALGPQAARHMGIDIARTERLSLIAIAALVAGGVAVTGIIAFVGLLVPHLVRLVVGASNKLTVVYSALLGALLVLVADTLARTLFQPLEIPIGLLTALLGAPVLLISLKRMKAVR